MVISKYNMKKNYCSPYEICIWEGVIDVILYIISLVIINLIGPTISDIKYPDNFFDYFENYNTYDFILCVIVIIFNFIYNISLLLSCDFFTPFHILVIRIIDEYYTYLQFNDDWTLNILGIIILILITFMFLIFAEIIEVNIFNISYNTKRNIDLRSKTDSSFENIIAWSEATDEEEEKSNFSISTNNNG